MHSKRKASYEICCYALMKKYGSTVQIQSKKYFGRLGVFLFWKLDVFHYWKLMFISLIKVCDGKSSGGKFAPYKYWKTKVHLPHPPLPSQNYIPVNILRKANIVQSVELNTTTLEIPIFDQIRNFCKCF